MASPPLPWHRNRLLEVVSLETGKHYVLSSYASAYRLQPDDCYGENFVLGDLPAGRYELSIPCLAVWRRVEIKIKPGAVTYFEFKGVEDYTFDLPAPENAPQD